MMKGSSPGGGTAASTRVLLEPAGEQIGRAARLVAPRIRDGLHSTGRRGLRRCCPEIAQTDAAEGKRRGSERSP